MNAKIQQAEWDFSGVCPAESETRCITEYALESASIQRLKMETRNAIAESGIRGKWNAWPTLDQAMMKLRHDLLTAGFYHNLILGHPGMMFVTQGATHPAIWPAHWLNVREADMRADARSRGVPAVEYTDESTLHGQPVERPPLYADEGKGTGQWLLSRKPPEDELFQMVWQAGRQSEAFSINWKEYRDEEIADEFKRWLQFNRPKDCPEPKARNGKRMIDHMRALGWLGMLRIHGCWSWRHPNFPPNVKSKIDENEFLRQCRKAKKRFHCLFPFLPPGEEPSCDTKERGPGRS